MAEFLGNRRPATDRPADYDGAPDTPPGGMTDADEEVLTASPPPDNTRVTPAPATPTTVRRAIPTTPTPAPIPRIPSTPSAPEPRDVPTPTKRRRSRRLIAWK
jgi:hypothetical protein